MLYLDERKNPPEQLHNLPQYALTHKSILNHFDIRIHWHSPSFLVF